MPKLVTLGQTRVGVSQGPKNLGERCSPPPTMRTYMTSRYMTVPTCVTTPNLDALAQTWWATERGPKKFGDAGPHRLRMRGGVFYPLRHALPHMCYHAEFGCSRSIIITEIIRKRLTFDPSRPALQGHSRSLDGSIGYEFLLVFLSHYRPISCRFQDK